MKNPIAIKRILSLTVLSLALSACTIEPVQPEKAMIQGAPEWVNNGSMIEPGKDGERFFHGVAFVTPQGDLALQKSLADDKARAEVGQLLVSYLDVVSEEYTASVGFNEKAENEDDVYKMIDQFAEKQVNDGVSSQINSAISRQFKKEVSPQFKEDIVRQIKEYSNRPIRYAISNQVDFYRELERDITSRIKNAVSRQIKKSMSESMLNAKIVTIWRDPMTNVVWSYAELDLKKVKDMVGNVKNMNLDLKSYFEGNAERIFDMIIEENQRKESSLYFWK